MKSKDYHANLADKGFPTPKQKSQFSSPGKNSSGPNSPTSPAVNPNKDAKDESADEAKVEDRFCGTIRFTDIPIPLSAPTDLICEECEKGNAKYYCAGCKQMFCRKCVDLCHPRICAEELMHEHEKNGWIRPVQHGDTSRVVKKDTFFPPDSLCYYEDFSKHRDISRGGSLCTGIKVPDTKGILVKEMPRYRPNDLVLFPDPTTQEEAYGKVISQWEQIHSEAAPAIVRGDGCSVFYYVQTLGFSKDIGDPEAFLLNNQSSLTSAFQEANEASNGLGLEVEPLARERHMARMLDKRIQDAKNTQVLGPKFHFRDVSDRSVLLPEPNPNVTYPGMLAQPSDGKYLGHVLSGHEQLGTEDRLALHYQAEFKRRLEEHEINVDLYASIDDRVEPSLHWRSLHRLPLPAMNRSYLDYLQSNTSLPNNIETALSIYILPETELTTIHERIRVMKEKKQAILHKVFIQRGAVVTKGIMKKRFLFWKNSMAELRRRKMHYCARKIQTRARVWLCRVSDCHLCTLPRTPFSLPSHPSPLI